MSVRSSFGLLLSGVESLSSILLPFSSESSEISAVFVIIPVYVFDADTLNATFTSLKSGDVLVLSNGCIKFAPSVFSCSLDK